MKKSAVLAEIITIGDELLIGQVVDTNSAFIAKQLNEIGVVVYQITSVQDDARHIKNALKCAEQHVDVIILTGGLGPTKDDITKHTITDYFNDTLVENKQVLNHIKAIWEKKKRVLLQSNIDQSLVPSKAKVLMNTIGTAPGMWFEKDETICISLPGVPYEMKALMTNEVIPKLKEKYNVTPIIHKTLLIHGISESVLASKIECWEKTLPKTIKLAYLPSPGRVRLRLTIKGYHIQEGQDILKTYIDNLLPEITPYFYGYEEQGRGIEHHVIEKLNKVNKTLALSESCTGGAISKLLTTYPGASTYFKGCVVPYATQSKIDILNIPKAIIDKDSVVSYAVAEAMARQTLEQFQSDYAIATTGNAGPNKGDSNIEIGTVFIAIATKLKTYSKRFNFGNNREKVIQQTINTSLEMLSTCLDNNE